MRLLENADNVLIVSIWKNASLHKARGQTATSGCWREFQNSNRLVAVGSCSANIHPIQYLRAHDGQWWRKSKTQSHAFLQKL